MFTEVNIQNSEGKSIMVCPFTIIDFKDQTSHDYTEIHPGEELITHVKLNINNFYYETNHNPCKDPKQLVKNLLIRVDYKDYFLNHKKAVLELKSPEIALSLDEK